MVKNKIKVICTSGSQAYIKREDGTKVWIDKKLIKGMNKKGEYNTEIKKENK